MKGSSDCQTERICYHKAYVDSPAHRLLGGRYSRISIPVVFAALNVNFGLMRSGICRPKEFICLTPIQHAWQPESVNAFTSAVHLLVAGGACLIILLYQSTATLRVTFSLGWLGGEHSTQAPLLWTMWGTFHDWSLWTFFVTPATTCITFTTLAAASSSSYSSKDCSCFFSFYWIFLERHFFRIWPFFPQLLHVLSYAGQCFSLSVELPWWPDLPQCVQFRSLTFPT